MSIGSLYQYFPNKESVLAAVMDLGMKAHADQIKKKIEEIDGKSLEETTAIIVDFGLELFLKEKTKIREIYMQAPELGRIPALLKVRQSVVERLADEIKKHHPECEREECIRISFIAANSAMGVIHTMLYDDTQDYSMAELSTEIKAMLNAYLKERLQNL